MKFIWNWLSGNTYTQTADTLVSETGEVFNRTPSGYVSQDGVFIERMNDQFVNTQTGQWSSTSDVFSKGDF